MKKRKQVEDQMGSGLWYQTHGQLKSHLWEKVEGSIGDQLKDSLMDRFWAQPIHGLWGIFLERFKKYIERHHDKA